MSIALATLVGRLEAAAPQRNGLPADYEQVARDAVAQLGSDVPVISSAPLAIVPGQSTYDLPADFGQMIALELFATASGVDMTTGFLVAGVGALATTERLYVEGDTLRIEPTPTYSATRTLRYAGGYALVNDAYPRLTENGARIALLYAQHLVLMAQAADAAAAGWKYQIGDEMVDRSQHGNAVQKAADSVLKQYLSAVTQLKGYGQRARYDVAGAAAWA